MENLTADWLDKLDQGLVLAIESSCDDTAAAVLRGNKVLSNIAASQEIHAKYGGVVPELASREHQKHIVPVVRAALEAASVSPEDLRAIAYTRGPGLLGSLLVGASFAKSMALALQLPLLEVHHMHAHILSLFIDDEANVGGIPELPFLCLTVSGGHTQLVVVRSPIDLEVIGQTRDDAAGEAFDKLAKLMGLPYPGGPLLDQLAQKGNPERFAGVFPHPKVEGLDFSFSGLKTAVRYFLQAETRKNEHFIEEHLADLSAAIQATIVGILMQRVAQAVAQTGIERVALAGGVSANSELRNTLQEMALRNGWAVHIPSFAYCTDNAAMIGMAGQFLHASGRMGSFASAPLARMPF